MLVFVAVVLQSAIVSSIEIAGGTPDLVLVTLVAVSLLRGAIWGAAVGFAAGLLLDIANLGRLGETSLLLTVAGYWIGRYGETTGRDRTHAPLLSVAVVTILYSAGALALHVVLGDPVDAGTILVGALIPERAAEPAPRVPRVRARASRARPPRVVARRRCGSLANRGNGRSPGGSSRPTRASSSPTA